ncbi:hypothetical protein [Yoonia sp. 2307UL14-13]|uniref:hypothetical protein n=1 Tax=Yoonia sp. 2307UL14-13 TaxID=3126506 RepID=UPI0030A26071
MCHWQGAVAEARLHLDSAALTLRGDIRATIARSDMRDVALTDDGVLVATPNGDLLMEFSPDASARWRKALLKTPPTLAEKLGVSEDSPAYVQGVLDDAALKAALINNLVSTPEDAGILVAIILEDRDLDNAAALAQSYPAKHIWLVYRKGKAAVIGDTVIRSHMRGLGFIDSKTSAVSDQLTATRYRLRAK